MLEKFIYLSELCCALQTVLRSLVTLAGMLCKVEVFRVVTSAVICSGAGLTEKNADSKTPLEVAKLNEQEEIAQLLQDKEADAFL